MRPTYVQFVLPSNKDGKCSIPVSNTINLSNSQLITQNQTNSGSLQLLNRTLSTVTPSQSCIKISAPSSTFNAPKQFIIQKANNLPTVQSISGIRCSSSISIPQVFSAKSNGITMIPNIENGNTDSSGMQPVMESCTIKRRSSPSLQTVNQCMKISKRIKSEEAGTKLGKRRQWTETETITFINVWIDYYPKLTTGGSRHIPIYNSMAEELNKVLVDRCLTGAEVKTKIGNLTTEYRRKKKDQGQTGASPSPWPYYDLIDKLLGERAYLNDSLLTDSIKIEGEVLGENDASPSAPNLNSTQIAEQVTDVSDLTIIAATNNIPSLDIAGSPSSSTVVSVDKPDNLVPTVSKCPKDRGSKKKRASDPKMDLIKDLFNKIESVSEAAMQSEIRVLELLEKQTRLQEESMNNEREFLNVFKTIMNNMTNS